MLRSLFAGVSGLRNHQVKMDVLGNNIANVNTVAFKTGRVTFKEGFAQLLQGASRPPGDHGGINPIQVGSGSQIGSVDTLMTQGNIEATGQQTDMAINGDAFFVVAKGTNHFYTRSGNFQLDADGRFVSPTNGFVVQGKMAKDGTLLDGITDVRLPVGQKTAALITSKVTIAGNVDSSAPNFVSSAPPAAPNINSSADRDFAANSRSYMSTSIGVFDSLGTKQELKITFWKTGATTWGWQVENPNPSAITFAGSGVATFASDGKLVTFSTPTVTSNAPADGANTMSITLDPGIADINGLTTFAGSNTAVIKGQNGYAAGQLENFSIDRSGIITGQFTNGVTVTLAQVALADFNNPGGLLRVGDNMYSQSGNSGDAIVSVANGGSQSTLTSGALELSNVDLAQEFTNMIITQRGFQANAKTITTSDEMLQELVNLKR